MNASCVFFTIYLDRIFYCACVLKIKDKFNDLRFLINYPRSAFKVMSISHYI